MKPTAVCVCVGCLVSLLLQPLQLKRCSFRKGKGFRFFLVQILSLLENGPCIFESFESETNLGKKVQCEHACIGGTFREISLISDCHHHFVVQPCGGSRTVASGCKVSLRGNAQYLY